MSLGSVCPQLTGLTFVKGSPTPVPPPGPCVLEFWATWCGPCRQTVPHLSAIAQRYQGRLPVIGISMDEDLEKLRRFVAEQGSNMAYSVVADLAGTAQQELYLKSGARGVPHAFVLDAEHKVVYSGHPMDPGMEAKLQAAAASASAPPPAPKRALPPVTEGLEELMGRSVKELKALLTERGVKHADCLEKADLARRVVEACSRVTHYV